MTTAQKIVLQNARLMVTALEVLSQTWSALTPQETDEINDVLAVGFPFDDCLEDTVIRAKSWIDSAENTVHHDYHNFKHAVFSIDGHGAWTGIHNPSKRWNGWSMPYFTEQTARQILDSYEGYWTYLFDDYKFLCYDNPEVYETDGEPHIFPAIIVEGIRYYGIGAGSWVWVAEDDKTFFCKDRTGRGGHYSLTLITIVNDPDFQEEYNDADDDDKSDTVIGWALSADVGDVYVDSDNASDYTRTA